MSQDIDAAVKGWDFRPGLVQARLVQAADARQVIPMRVDLGLLQIETTGRPDGTRPHGCATYFEYLRQQARVADRAGQSFVLSEEQCEEADREFIQYYHRRICWLALRNYQQAIADADHTLGLMDFCRDHSTDEQWTLSHEQYRPFVLFHRTQASALAALSDRGAEAAVEEITKGLDRMKQVFVDYEAEEEFDEDELVQRLVELRESLRQHFRVGRTLQEQLADAIANEKYELAAEIRDELNRRDSRAR